MATGGLKIIELNPRLWMQHALVGRVTGNALVRRYLGLEDEPDAADSSCRYWLNSIYTLSRLLRLDLRSMARVVGRPHEVAPPWGAALVWSRCGCRVPEARNSGWP